MVGFNGNLARIKSLGGLLPEYPVTDPTADGSESSTATAFVKAVPGAAFSIEVCSAGFLTRYPGQGITWEFNIDGIHVNGFTVTSPLAPSQSMHSLAYHVEGQFYARNFQFAEVQTLEHAGDVIPANATRLPDIGKIELRCYRSNGGVMHTRDPNRGIGPGYHREFEDPSVPEKSIIKGGKSLATRFGRPEPVDIAVHHRFLRPNFIDEYPSKPFVTFRFLYRTRRSLELLGIVPDPVSKVLGPSQLHLLPQEELFGKRRLPQKPQGQLGKTGVKRGRRDDSDDEDVVEAKSRFRIFEDDVDRKPVKQIKQEQPELMEAKEVPSSKTVDVIENK